MLGREGNRYLNRMADSTMYMQQLIHDLIDLSRVGRSGVERSRSTWHGWGGHRRRSSRCGGGIGIEGDHGTDVRIVLPAAVGARWPSHQLTAGSMR